MDNLKRFLREVKAAYDIYKEKIDEKLNICIGNVSCDMDSAIGAILLAYYLSEKNNYRADYGNYELFWLPIINCPRNEIESRIDIFSHLERFGISKESLVFNDDLDIDFYSENNLLEVAIIDHNQLDINQEKWTKAVNYIYDHHIDMKVYGDQLKQKIITFCGSACSLVINAIAEDDLERILTKEICEFFSSAILLDTENFKPSLRNSKWGELDEKALLTMSRISLTEMYNNLISKKFDRELNLKLGLELLLKKDYKNYTWNSTITGMSVIFNPLHEIMSTYGQEELKAVIRQKMDYQKLNFYAIITQTYLNSGEALREIMLYDDNVERLAKITAYFETVSPFPLQKKKFTGLSKNFSSYLIKDSSVSRKKIEPVFKKIFEENISNK